MNEYYLIIGEKSKIDNNNLKNSSINIDLKNNEDYNLYSEEIANTGISNMKKKIKYNKGSLKDIKLPTDILKNLKGTNGKWNINIYDEINNINIIYSYQNKNTPYVRVKQNLI